MKYWLIVTSPENFKHDREVLGFTTQGVPHRFRKQVQRMNIGDRAVIYIMRVQKFGAATTITGDYYEDKSKLWTDKDESWPSRRKQKPDIVLNDDELIDAKKLIADLTFVENKEYWGAHFQGSIKLIPEEDFKLIESEMRKIIGSRTETSDESVTEADMTEEEYEKLILELPLQTNSLHDRIGEMLEQIGSWMDYNTQTRHRIIPEHAYELDVAWLNGKNPEIAIEVQISGNLTEAKDRLSHARKFNYRKVIMVLKTKDLTRLNSLMKHEPELRSWMEAWSIGSVYEMYTAGETFFKYYRRLREAVFKEKREIELIR